jgi:hypothetical protein
MTEFWNLDPAARACFDGWVKRLAGMGVGMLSDVDRVVVGAVAVSEASLVAARRSVTRSPGQSDPVALREERAALQAYQKAIDWLEKSVGQRVGSVLDAEVGRALPEPAGRGAQAPRLRVARGQAEEGARGRILEILSTGVGLGKDALFDSAGGDASAFLKALRALTEEGAVVRSGSGRRGRPYIYRLREAS